VWGGAALAGPLLGGFLSDHVSWRWVFYINVPFGAAAIALIAAGLGEPVARHGRPRLDLPGLVLFTSGVSTLMLGLLFGGEAPSWYAPPALGRLVLTPFVLGWVSCSIVSARLVLRVGYRAVVIAGMLSLTTGFLLFAQWDATLTLPRAMGAVLIAGTGMGMTMVPMLIAVQNAVARRDLGAVTSMTQFFRTIGGTIGVSVMGAAMTHRLQLGRDIEWALHGVFVIGLV